MTRWLCLFAILSVMTVAAFVVSLQLQKLTPEGQYRAFSEHCDRVQNGMTVDEVDILFGVDPRGIWLPSVISDSDGREADYWPVKSYKAWGPGDTRCLDVTFYGSPSRGFRVVKKQMENSAGK
jgi:hypothetical protein